MHEGKKEIYRVSGDNVLVKITDGVYAEKSRTNNTTVKYISVNDGSVNVSNTIPVITSDDSISGAGSYYIKTCEDKTYKITNASGEEVAKCGIRAYWELPYIVYRKFEKDEKSAILIQQENEVSLYDLDHKKVLKTYNHAGDVELFENSPFVKMSAGSGKKQICNLLNTGANCVNIMNDEEIVAYPTFIRVGRVTYSYGLTEVYNASQE